MRTDPLGRFSLIGMNAAAALSVDLEWNNVDTAISMVGAMGLRPPDDRLLYTIGSKDGAVLDAQRRRRDGGFELAYAIPNSSSVLSSS